MPHCRSDSEAFFDLIGQIDSAFRIESHTKIYQIIESILLWF